MTTYREQFADEGQASDYDNRQYARGSYSSILWEIEKPQLAGIIDQLRESCGDPMDYLDFASGTGRIISFVESQVGNSTGIEISEQMSERARTATRKSTILCKDITGKNDAPEGKYDLITTFRFVLNAETDLRIAGLSALVLRLKDDRSLLVFNNHGNSRSIKLLTWPIHWFFRKKGQHVNEGNLMSHREIVKLVEQVGLEIVGRQGCGVLGGTLSRFLPASWVAGIEKRMAASRLFSGFGINQMYVTRRKSR